MFEGEIEVDESYFGKVRQHKRSHGAAGKIVIFGLLKRNETVYTVAALNTQLAALFYS